MLVGWSIRNITQLITLAEVALMVDVDRSMSFCRVPGSYRLGAVFSAQHAAGGGIRYS